MSLSFLAIYIALVFLRPMDWWAPILGWPIVNPTAIMTLLASFTRILGEIGELWKKLPPMRLAVYLLFGVTISWIYPLWLTGMWATFQEFGKVIVLFFLIILLGREQKSLQVLVWVVLLCIAWMAVHGVLQIQRGYGFGGQTPVERSIYSPDGELLRTIYQTRAFGIFDDPNDVCLVFIFAIPLLFAQYRAAGSVFTRTLAICLIPLMGYAAWITNSRGGVIGIFGMIAAHAVVRTKSAIRRWLLTSVAIAVVTVIAPARFNFAVDLERADLWGKGIELFKEYPFFGVGYGAIPSYTERGKLAHNSYITALAELGLVGYIPFVMLIVGTMYYLRKATNLKPTLPREDQALLSGSFSALMGYLTAIYFLTRTYTVVLYILLALAICQVVISAQKAGQFEAVFDNWPRLRMKLVIWSLASVPVLWIVVRLCNKMAGRG